MAAAKGTFYMTYARSRPRDIVPYAEENNIGLMTNAAHRYSEATGEFKDLWDYDTRHIVDSGGYNIQRGWVKKHYDGKLPAQLTQEYVARAVENCIDFDSMSQFYPWTVEEYHEWLSQYDFNWAAAMDYACEEVYDPMHSVEEKIQKTVENTERHFELGPDYNLLPVLQGRSVDDYVKCYNMLKESSVDIPLTHVGLGTVCRISSSKEIVRTEREIRERCDDIEYIHGFGVKINAYKLGATFESADSQAWVYPASNGRCYTLEDGKLGEIEMGDNSRKRTVESFKNYYQYVSRLMNRPTQLPDIELSEETKKNGSQKQKVKQSDFECLDCDYDGKDIVHHSVETGHSISD